jgi:hypothetical protein
MLIMTVRYIPVRLKYEAVCCIAKLVYRRFSQPLIVFLVKAVEELIWSCDETYRSLLIAKLAETISSLSKQEFSQIRS